MLVSIIIPVYNAEPYLEDCLDSVLGQTHEDIQVILVDDASTDGSLAVCRRYAELDRRIVLLENGTNVGQVGSYKRGFQESAGSYIGFVDSDDWIEPDMYETLLRAIEQTGADVSVCGLWQELPGGNRSVEKPFETGLIGGEALRRSLYDVHASGNDLLPSIGLYRCNKLFKKSLVASNIQYADPLVRVFEDNNLVIPILADCEILATVDKPLYHYRRHARSTMTRFDESIVAAREACFKAQRTIFEDKNIPHRIQSDVLRVDSYILVRAIRSCDGTALSRLLSMFESDMSEWNVRIADIMRFRTPLKLRLLLLAIRARMHVAVLLSARILRAIRQTHTS